MGYQNQTSQIQFFSVLHVILSLSHFLSCDRQEVISQLFNIIELKSISLSFLGGGGEGAVGVCFSNAVDPLCRWHCFFIIDRVFSNAAANMIRDIYTQHFKSSSLWELFSRSKKLFKGIIYFIL